MTSRKQPKVSPVSATGYVEGERLVTFIDDRWVDVTSWRKAHPGGPRWIELFDKRNCTEVVHAFHSAKALKLIKHLPTAETAHVPTDKNVVFAAKDTQLMLDFRKLRQKLMLDGWWKRNWIMEAWHFLSYFAVMTLSIAMTQSSILRLRCLAFLPLGIAFTYSTWMAHDYIHGRDTFCSYLRNWSALSFGLSPSMWSAKHNTHHALTNEVGVDEDLPGGPVLFIWAPNPKNDKPWRKFQHIYFCFAFCLLFVVWKVDSVKTVWGYRNGATPWIRKNMQNEQILIAMHYVIALSVLPVGTYICAMMFSGFITATIVTSSHQNEDLMLEHEPDWVRSQIQTTRDAVTLTPFTEWLWGGMQYQLAHHLAPTMPRYRYPALRKVLSKFAKEHNMEYRLSNEFEIVKNNYYTYFKTAMALADPHGRSSKGGQTL